MPVHLHEPASAGDATTHCTAALVFRIDDGIYGETRLDGMKFALVIRSGKVMADGDWVFARRRRRKRRTRPSARRLPQSSAARPEAPRR